MAATSAVITLIGIESALNRFENKSVFDDMVLPSGIDKDTLVNTILLNAGSFELLYSDPTFLKSSIYIWSREYYETFKRWAVTLSEEYNPIENYNRYEDSSIDHKGSSNSESSSQSSGTSKGESKTNEDVTTTGSVAGFNSSTFENKDKSVTDDDTTSESSGEYSNKDSGKGSSSDQFKDITKSHIHGNIGVTTSAKMVSEEMDLRLKYNLYKMISDLFIKEFCIMTY